MSGITPDQAAGRRDKRRGYRLRMFDEAPPVISAKGHAMTEKPEPDFEAMASDALSDQPEFVPPNYPRVAAYAYAQGQASRAQSAQAGAEDLRKQGWAVAVHNDYRLNGRPMTFWLWTHAASGRFVKGEGPTDAEALQQCAEVARAIDLTPYKVARRMNKGGRRSRHGSP